MLYELTRTATSSILKPFAINQMEAVQVGKTVDFARSSIQFGKYTYTAYRRITRGSSNSWDETRVVLKSNNNVIFEFDRGEDPRFLVMDSKLKLYFQEYLPNTNDCRIYIYDIRNKYFEIFNPPSPFGFNGKNWGIFENEQGINIAFSVQPLQIAKIKPLPSEIVFVEYQINNFWGDDQFTSIGFFRCGTMPFFLESHGLYLAFCHVTLPEPSKSYHQLGIVVWTKDFQLIKRKVLSSFIEGLLIDPYNLIIIDNEVHVDVTSVLGKLHDIDSLVQNFRIMYYLDEIIKFVFRD